MASSATADQSLLIFPKEVLRKNFCYLTEELLVDDILDQLYQNGVIEEDDKERITYETTRQRKTKKLLSILSYKPDSDTLKFIEILHVKALHIWKKLNDTTLDATKKKFSVTIQEQSTIEEFLEICARDILQAQKGAQLQVNEVHERFCKEVNSCGLPHKVSCNMIENAIKKVFPDAIIDIWCQQKKKKKKTIDNQSVIKHVTWKKGIAQRTVTAEYNSRKETKVKSLEETGCDMDEWNVKDVSQWLGKLGIEEDIVEAFQQQKIAGDILKIINQAEIKDICPAIKFGDMKRIIMARDNLVPSATISDGKVQEQKPLNKGVTIETPRSFDKRESNTTVYRKGRYLPSPNTHAGDPLTRIQMYYDESDMDIQASELSVPLQFQLAKFVASCLNESVNGTLYFGIKEDGLIVGSTNPSSTWQQLLEESVKNFFFSDQIDKVKKCIRPLHFVEVSDGELKQCSPYVVELDVVPSHSICEEDVFFIRKPCKKKARIKFQGNCLFRIIDGKCNEVAVKEIPKFFEMKKKLSQNRKQRELTKNQQTEANVNLGLKLQQLLCRGEDTLDGDLFPILVTCSFQNSYSDEEMKECFHFMKVLPWKAVLDFDDKGLLFDYLENKEDEVLKVLKVEDFDPSYDPNQKNKDRLHNLLQDMKCSAHRPWIFANGYEAEDLPAHDVVRWKQERSEGFKEVVRFLKHDIPQGRAVVVFMLFSKNHDVMLEAADELVTKFREQWFILGPTDEVADCWLNGFHHKHLVERKKDLTEKSVIGIPWKHVNDTISRIVGTVSDSVCELPTSKGAIVKLSKKNLNAWCDLEILSAKQCEKKENPLEFASEIEENFYRGGEVDWWNFYYKDHVLQRECFPKILETVRDTLRGNTVQDDRIECISLYHQPGAGGTTTAKQVLWELRSQYRCAIVKQITSQTGDQISKLHIYEDQRPKPVLLLFDNLDEERISALRAELDEKAKQLGRCFEDTPASVFYVFLLCIRKTDLKEEIGSRYFRLKHELTVDEQTWFRSKYQELKKKYEKNAKMGVNPKHLISFNILKENFNHEFIAKTVKDLLKEITDPNERTLLKYVSMLNAYDIGFQSLPASAFNAIMERRHKRVMFSEPKRWELHISQSLKILLYQFNKKKTNAGQHIRIIHNILSKQILSVFIEQYVQEATKQYSSCLYSIFSDFLDCGIFNAAFHDNSVEQLLKIVRDVVKRRPRSLENGKPETKFSPVIEEIIRQSKEDVEEAADLLKQIYTFSEDVFVGQQLARLYIHSKNWEKAKEFAEEITRNKSDNSYLWDTYGHAFKEELREKYAECLENGTKMNHLEARDVLDLAFRAIDIFQKEQEVSAEERSTYTNNAGYFQELQVAIIMLDCLSNTEGLDANTLHQILVQQREMPSELLDCLGEDRVNRLKRVQIGVTKALVRLEDEHLQLRDDMADEYHKRNIMSSKEMLIKYKESLEHYYGEEKNEVPPNLTQEEACQFRRRRIFRLAGHTFRAVFELKRKPHGKTTLMTILKMAQENIDSVYRNLLDLQILIAVKLTLCCMDEDYRQTIKRNEMANIAADLYEQRDKLLNNSLEPYLFAAMLNWPSQDPCCRKQRIPAYEIPDVLKHWRTAYYNKYPRQREEGRPYRKKETTMFFLGNGEEMDGIAFDQELKTEGTKINSEYFWNLPNVLKRLERWSGTLISDGSDVKINVIQAGNKLSLIIPTSLPIFNRSLWNKKVYFVIGFTWAGPKAFDIRLENPKMKNKATHQAPAAIQKSSTKTGVGRLLIPALVQKYNELRRQLDSLESIKKIPYNKRTKEQKRLLQMEPQLKEEFKQAYNLMYSDY